MKKALLALTAIVLGIAAAGWWFFAYGGTASSVVTEEQRAILKIQDERLSRGSTGAPVRIVEYVDVLCPYCAQASQPGGIIPRLMEEYVDTEQAHYEVRVVAMTSPDSERAGVGAYCAAEQDRFWQFIDKAYSDTWQQYYSQNKEVSDVKLFQENTIYSFARSVPDLDLSSWQYCMDNNAYAGVMKDNADDMVHLEAHGTPSMVVDGKSYTGTPPYPAFQAVINASLNEKKAEADAH